MKSIPAYEYRPYTAKNILLTFVASGALGLLALCGGFVLLGPRTADNPVPRRVSLGTVALEEVAGREASSAVGSYGAAVALVVCGAFAPVVGYWAVRKCLRRQQRIALHPKGVLLPVAETPIAYGRIRKLDVWRVHPADPRALSIVYDKSKRCNLYESGLPSPGAFDEIYAVLTRRVKAAADNAVKE